MLASFVSGAPIEFLLDPESEPWQRTKPDALPLMGTPLGLQPTAAIRSTWFGKKIGAIERVLISAIHNGEMLAIRMQWADPSETRTLSDSTAFPDAAAVAFPGVPGAPLVTMGAPGAPVNVWYWRADDDGAGRQLVAEGIGTSRTVDQTLVRSHGVWKDGSWRVVIGRALRAEGSEPLVQLAAGKSTRFGVAIWEGASGERGGIKAFSGDWRGLDLAASTTAGRS